MGDNISMNIFVLNENPVIAAQEQCDKHVVKMIVESAQMLSTAHRMLDDPSIPQTIQVWQDHDQIL